MWIAVTITILLFLWHLYEKRIRDVVANIPGPYNLPLFGAIHIYPSLNSKTILPIFGKAAVTHGSVFKMWVFNQLYVISADAELSAQILSCSTGTNKFRAYRVFKPAMGEGLLTSNGERWRIKRKILTPTFHFKIMERYVEIFDEQANLLIHCLKPKADGKTAFDIWQYMTAVTLDSIVETAVGAKLNSLTDPNTEVTQAINNSVALTGWRFSKVYVHNETIFSILYPHLKRRQTKDCKTLHDFSLNIIKQQREILEKSINSPADHGIPQKTEEEDEFQSKKRMNLLGLLLQSRIEDVKLSDRDIVDEVCTFVGAGNDTTATLLSFTCYLLARHPEVQNKLWEELDSVFGADTKKMITLQDVNGLHYLDCVIKESLRVYPPVPLIARHITEDFKFEHSRYGDCVIPTGTEVFIDIFDAMHNSEVYENPYDFIPERYYNTPEIKSPFIPFSIGPRNCIGQKYAMAIAKVVLAKVIRAYELLPYGENVSLIMDIALRSTTGIQVGLRPRSQKLHLKI